MVQSVGLGIQVPDFGRSLAQGFQLRAMGEQMEGNNALRAMLAQPGVTQGLLAGDPNILAQIAGIGPQGLQVAAPIMAGTQQRQDMLAGRAEDRDFRERDFRLREEAARRAGMPAPDRELVPVMTAEGPRLVPRAQAAGMQPFIPGQAEPLVPVVTPQGPRLMPRSQAAGMEPAPSSPQVVVDNRGASAFDSAIGGAAAKALDTSYTQATQAQATLAAGQRVLSLLPDAITGTAAPLRLMAARIGASLGVNDGEAVRATQTLMAELARGTLAQSEKLKGVASETDMRLLARASGGDLTLDGEAIRRIAQLSELVATDTITAYNDLVGRSQLTGPAANVYRPIEVPRASGAPVRVTSPEAAMRLPPGTAIELPDGSLGRVPGP